MQTTSATWKWLCTEGGKTLPPATYTGDLVSFDNPGYTWPKNVTIGIEPVQDLHGYDHPWPAGGGKNLLDESQIAQNKYVNKDNGGIGNSNNSDASDYIKIEPNTTYYFGETGTTGVTEWAAYYDANKDYVSGAVLSANSAFTTPADVAYLRTSLQKTRTNAYVNYPSTVTTYSPYSNICPISGWTGANVTRMGFNVWNEEWEVGGLSTSSGGNIGATDRIRSKNYIQVFGGVQYYIASPKNIQMLCYDSSKGFFDVLSWGRNNTVTLPTNTYYVRFQVDPAYGTTYNYDICINLSDPAKNGTYEPGHVVTYPISFPSEAGTVYGGTLDVTTGLMTVDRAYISNEELCASTGWNTAGRGAYVAPSTYALPSNASSAYINPKLSATALKTDSQDNLYDNYGIGIAQWWGTRIGICTGDASITSISDFKEWFAENGSDIVYPLATPITYQLTPTEVGLLLGDNNVWADTGDITVVLESPQGLHLETKAIISGTDYTDITSLVINRAVMQGGLSIGNAVSANCSFMIRTNDPIPKSAPVQIKMRLASDTSVSEWLPAGTFYISHRSRDPITGVLSVEGYDALLKGNAVLSEVPWTTGTGAVMTTGTGEWIYFRDVWPRKMSDLLNDILMLLDVELDARTQINTGSAYVLERPEGEATVNLLLGRIAAAHGGSFIITPEGKLRLVPVVSAAGATPQTAVPVAGVLNRMALGGGGTVTGIRYRAGEEDRVVGDESGIVIDADVSAALAAAVYSQLNDVTYQAYELSGALYDPAVELGDYIRAGVNDDVLSVLYSETATYGPMFRGDIGAPEPGELSDEYPYIGQSAKALSAAKVYADKASRAAAQALDNTLTQQEIFDRLTDGGLEQGLALEATMPSLGAAGEKKLYLNLDYARFGKLVADFIQGGTLTLGGLDNADGVLRVLDAGGNEIGTWDNTGITLNKGAIAGPSVTLGGAGNADGVLQVLDSSGNVIGTFDNSGVDITDGSFTSYSQDRLYRAFLDVGKLTFQYYGVDPGQGGMEWIDGVSLEMADNSTAYLHARNRMNVSGSSGIDLFTYKASTQRSEITLEDNEITLTAKDTVGLTTITLDGNSIVMDPDGGGVSAELNGSGFFVTGTKSRLVHTDQYGDRLLYCYETPSPMFGDVGEGVIGGDGLCYVALDAVFAQTIGDGGYQVFLQKYGAGDCWVKERRGGCFIVEGTPGTAFGWEIKAKQRDYEQRRLDRNDERFSVPAQQYGAEAAQYIEELMNGRVSA